MAGGVSMTASRMPDFFSLRQRLAQLEQADLGEMRRRGLRAHSTNATDEPCGSVSISATGPMPASSASTARWPDKVVLPEPPFWEANTRTCMRPFRR